MDSQQITLQQQIDHFKSQNPKYDENNLNRLGQNPYSGQPMLTEQGLEIGPGITKIGAKSSLYRSQGCFTLETHRKHYS